MNKKNKSNIILYVAHHTAKLGYSTGIERTVRKVAKYLIDSGKIVVPVGYNIDTKQIYILDNDELDRLSWFNGPSVDSWERNNSIDYYLGKADYCICGELLYNGNENVIDRLSSIKKYSIFYDVVPIELPQMYGEYWKYAHYRYLEKLPKYDKVFSISEFSKNEYFRLIDDKTINMEVILLPNHYDDWPTIDEKINNSKDITIFSIATFNPRKNHKTLVKAFYLAHKILKDDGYNLKLNLIGKNSPDYSDITDYVIKYSKLCNINYIGEANSDDVVYENYKDADFTIYPSLYEGYGLPVVESVFFNTPCISSNTSSMPEITKNGGCLTFDPNSVKELTDLIILLSKNSEKRRELVREMQSIKKRTWKDYVSDIIEGIERDIYE
jgi:glycosyltransferase involved in cell wall biosynthesis